MFQTRDPKAAGLDEDRKAVTGEKIEIAGRLHIGEEAIGDIGGDVELLLAHPEAMLAVHGPCRRLLMAGVRRLPGILRARVAVRSGVGDGAVEGVVAIGEQGPRHGGLGVDVEGQKVDLGVPEDVAAIALAGQRVGADIDPLVLLARCDQQVVDAVAHGFLRRAIAFDHDVAVPPALGEGGDVIVQGPCPAVRARHRQGFQTGPLEPDRIDVARGPDRDQLVDAAGGLAVEVELDALGHGQIVDPPAPGAAAGERRAIGEMMAAIERAHLQIDGVVVTVRAYRFEMPAFRPFFEAALRIEDVALVIGRQTIEIETVTVDPALYGDRRFVVLAGDLGAQCAEMRVGEAGETEGFEAGAPALSILETGQPVEEALADVEQAAMLQHGHALHAQPLALDPDRERQPVGAAHQIDHGRIMMIVDAGEKGAGEITPDPLLETAARAEIAVADGEQRLVIVQPGEIEGRFLDQPFVRAQEIAQRHRESSIVDLRKGAKPVPAAQST